MLLWLWMLWEWRLTLLCALGFTMAVAYAGVDGDFADRLLWIRRDLHYPNHIVISCGSNGECSNLQWNAYKAEDRTSRALTIEWNGRRYSAQDLADAARLRAAGWQQTFADPQHGVAVLRAPGSDAGMEFVQVTVTDGRLSSMLVRMQRQGRITIGDRSGTLPARRTDLTASLGPPVEEVRINAINGPM